MSDWQRAVLFVALMAVCAVAGATIGFVGTRWVFVE